MTTHRKRILYHCSEIDHGEHLTVVRKTPKFPSSEEPPVPRLCVSPTVPGCLAGRLFDGLNPVHVYATPKPVRGITPRNVWDEPITKERWLIPPAVLHRVATIPVEDVREIMWRQLAFHVQTQKPARFEIRLCTACVAWDVLGERFPSKKEERVIRRACRTFLKMEPQAWLNQLLQQSQP